MKKIVLATVTGLSVLALVGCGSSSSSSSSSSGGTDSCTALDSETFNCGKMLSDIVEHTVQPLVTDFSIKVQGLANKTTAYCSALSSSGDESAALAEARMAWQENMDVWQQLEVMQFGPLKTKRDEVYSWPLNDSCKYDDEVVSSLEEGYDISGITPARRGIASLEYLLFNEDPSISCTGIVPDRLIDWDNKSPEAKLADRCGYAEKVSADLIIRAESLVQDYVDYDLSKDAGSLQDAANLVSDALFYIDKKTKDDKLTALLPQTEADTFKLGSLEFDYADAARDAVHNNLIGALAIMNGTGGNGGLRDYLVAAGQSALADEMITELNTAISSSSDTEITQSFRAIMTAATGPNDVSTCINAETAATDLEKLCSLDNEVKAFTDDLKGQFVLTLGFTTPSDAEGDND